MLRYAGVMFSYQNFSKNSAFSLIYHIQWWVRRLLRAMGNRCWGKGYPNWTPHRTKEEVAIPIFCSAGKLPSLPQEAGFISLCCNLYRRGKPGSWLHSTKRRTRHPGNSTTSAVAVSVMPSYNANRLGKILSIQCGVIWSRAFCFALVPFNCMRW